MRRRVAGFGASAIRPRPAGRKEAQMFREPEVNLSPKVADEVKHSTCYMCACRCGIKVHIRDGKIRYIEGARNHPVNKGVLCGKGSSGIMQHYSPARLRKPLKRIGERGAGEFVEIEWDEAMEIARARLDRIRRDDPKKLAFFTGRDQSQSLTGWWAMQFGTPNFAAHGGFCSVNMAAAGLYTVGGSFWEFGEPDWDRAKYLMLFGVAEDHDSNPIKIGLGKMKARGAKIVSINPIRTGYSAIADEWIGLRPGTDGLFVLSLAHELLNADAVDLDFLVRYCNAGWLVVQAPGTADHGLFARGGDGEPLSYDKRAGAFANAKAPGIAPAVVGEFILPDGRKAVPAFQLIAARYMEKAYAPEAVAPVCGIDAAVIRRIAAEIAEIAFEQPIEIKAPWTDWAGRVHDKIIGRPVAMHAMRGISAHSNGFQTCRAIHLLQCLIGAVECPGGFRFKPPYPKPIPPAQKPAGKTTAPMTPLPGMPLGFVTGPEDLLVDADGAPLRIDKAYSWEAPIAAHGLMHMVIANARAGDPYKIDTLLLYMANMSWNSAMNTARTMEMLTDKDANGEYKIPYIIYSDAYASEMVAYADLVLPDTTYLERWDCISLLDRPISDADGPADAIRQPVVTPDRDVRAFQSVLIDLGARLGLPGMTNADGTPKYPGGYPDYIINHERSPGIGPLAGWRGANGGADGRGGINPKQLDAYVANQCFWRHELAEHEKFYKFANKAYLDFAVHMGFIGKAEQIVIQLYSEPMQKFRLAAEGHGAAQPPEDMRERLKSAFDPLPIWYEPHEEAAIDRKAFPLHALTQRPMIMYHSWGSQNAWLRQILGRNKLYVATSKARELGLEDDDWARVTSHSGAIKVQIKTMDGVNPDTVWTWNAVGKRAGAWSLDPAAPEACKGFLLNHLISEHLPDGSRSNSDPVTGQAAWFDLCVRIEKCEPGEEVSEPQFPALPPLVGLTPAPDVNQYGADLSDRRRNAR
jgi:anaerobic selenocysteine-containing dehydrogenase